MNDNEKAIFDILKVRERIEIGELKELAGLSRKGWDKGMKGLSKQGLTKVEKTEAAQLYCTDCLELSGLLKLDLSNT